MQSDAPRTQMLTLSHLTLTAKSNPIVSYCLWIFSARSSKSRTMDGFSRDIAWLSPEETIAGHVCAMQSQSWRFAKHTPLWFPRRQYKAPYKTKNVILKKSNMHCSYDIYISMHPHRRDSSSVFPNNYNTPYAAMQPHCQRVLKIFRTILFMLKNCFNKIINPAN